MSEIFNLYGVLIILNFNGCLRNLYFDYKDILYCFKVDFFGCDMYGFLCFYCLVNMYVLVNFLILNMYLKFSKVFF